VQNLHLIEQRTTLRSNRLDFDDQFWVIYYSIVTKFKGMGYRNKMAFPLGDLNEINDSYKIKLESFLRLKQDKLTNFVELTNQGLISFFNELLS